MISFPSGSYLNVCEEPWMCGRPRSDRSPTPYPPLPDTQQDLVSLSYPTDPVIEKKTPRGFITRDDVERQTFAQTLFYTVCSRSSSRRRHPPNMAMTRSVAARSTTRHRLPGPEPCRTWPNFPEPRPHPKNYIRSTLG